ncbi:hypothetical protein C9J27_03120 [Photobacterium kishitanii]|uniref:Uncharacterized protein n=1 Tax=Photobacterium kishitanii TaxID=318456 RepID=A0A2T3KMM3_9GAMM|nr:hypothetical protein C9J27_03120 [Photobacterium kishitanii]
MDHKIEDKWRYIVLSGASFIACEDNRCNVAVRDNPDGGFSFGSPTPKCDVYIVSDSDGKMIIKTKEQGLSSHLDEVYDYADKIVSRTYQALWVSAQNKKNRSNNRL